MKITTNSFKTSLTIQRAASVLKVEYSIHYIYLYLLTLLIKLELRIVIGAFYALFAWIVCQIIDSFLAASFVLLTVS